MCGLAKSCTILSIKHRYGLTISSIIVIIDILFEKGKVKQMKRTLRWLGNYITSLSELINWNIPLVWMRLIPQPQEHAVEFLWSIDSEARFPPLVPAHMCQKLLVKSRFTGIRGRFTKGLIMKFLIVGTWRKVVLTIPFILKILICYVWL